MTPEKLVVERQSSALWDGLVSGAMLVVGSVVAY